MADFDDHLKKAKDQDARQAENREHAVFKAAQVKAHGPDVFQQLVRELQARAEEFNQAFPDEERRIARIEPFDNAFKASRDYLPEVEAELLADYAANRIDLVILTRTTKRLLPEKTTDRRYAFDLQSSGQIYISDGNKPVSNDTIIGQFFEPFFQFK